MRRQLIVEPGARAALFNAASGALQTPELMARIVIHCRPVFTATDHGR
jgi:hypothetical protein